MLNLIQDKLVEVWTGELYSPEFKESPAKHKDFTHAILHVMKATGQLASMAEGLDHSEEFLPKREDAEKYLADIVICALRMGNTFPGGRIDMRRAVLDRIEKKMGVKIL